MAQLRFAVMSAAAMGRPPGKLASASAIPSLVCVQYDEIAAQSFAQLLQARCNTAASGFWTLDTRKELKYFANVHCPFTEYLSRFANKRKQAEVSGISFISRYL
jgi:hypothetical protein